MPYPPDALLLRANAPYVLVADDDAPSRYFLGEAFGQLGARVALAADGGEALQQARMETFDLLVLDCRMPIIGALGVLTALRSEPDACSRYSPVVAGSAELDVHARQSLLAAGFDAVLLKPCTLQDLQKVLGLAAVQHRDLPVLDDGLALNASGTAAIVQALRGLFLQELLKVDQELDALSADAKALETRLHTLRSSCGFCGAAALSGHIVSLQRYLKRADHGAVLPLADFRQSLLHTIRALE